MRKNLAIVFCLSFIIVFFAGCESGEEISSVSIPENSETITIPVSQESANSINVTDSNGKTIDVSSNDKEEKYFSKKERYLAIDRHGNEVNY